MEERRALEAAAMWLAARASSGGPETPFGLRDFLALELERVVPRIELHGVGEVEDEPTLLMLAPCALFLASASIDAAGTPSAELLVVPLLPRPSIKVLSVPSPDLGSRKREWILTPTPGAPLTITTSEVVHAAFSADVRPDPGEELMRTLLGRVVGEGTT